MRDTALPDAVGMSAPGILKGSGFDLGILAALGSSGLGAAVSAGFLPLPDRDSTQHINIAMKQSKLTTGETDGGEPVVTRSAFSFRGEPRSNGSEGSKGAKGSKVAKPKSTGIMALLARRKVAMGSNDSGRPPKPAGEKKEKETTGEETKEGGVETRGRKARTQDQVIETYRRAATDVINSGPSALVWTDSKSPALAALTRFRKEAKNKMDFAKDGE